MVIPWLEECNRFGELLLRRFGFDNLAVDGQPAAAGAGASPGQLVPLERMPAALLLRLPGATWRVKESYPPGVFPMKPWREADLDPDRDGRLFSRRQYPLQPAGTITCRAAQGMSLPGMVALGDP